MGVIVREIVYKIKSLYTNQKTLVSLKEPQYKPRWRSETPSNVRLVKVNGQRVFGGLNFWGSFRKRVKN